MAVRELHTEIEIAASASTVWKHLVDFSRYPEWNPFVRSIVGEARQGARLKVSVSPPGGRGMTFRPVLLALLPEKELRWLGRLLLPGLFDGEHRFAIEPLSEGRVRFVHAERFAGILVGLLWKTMEEDTRRGFEAMNDALKQVAEESAKPL